MRQAAGAAGLVAWALASGTAGFGCGHVDQDRYAGPKTPIAPGEVGKLEGRYAYADPRCDGCSPTRVAEVLKGHGTFTRGSAQPPPDEKSASVTLAVVDSRHVKLVVLASGAVWSEQLLEGQVEEGLFAIGTANFFEMVWGPIVWAWIERGVQLGLDDRRNLIVHTKISGLIFFLIVPVTGNTGPNSVTFARLNGGEP